MVVILEDSFVAQSQPPRDPLFVLGDQQNMRKYGLEKITQTGDLLVHLKTRKSNLFEVNGAHLSTLYFSRCAQSSNDAQG